MLESGIEHNNHEATTPPSLKFQTAQGQYMWFFNTHYIQHSIKMVQVAEHISILNLTGVVTSFPRLISFKVFSSFSKTGSNWASCKEPAINLKVTASIKFIKCSSMQFNRVNNNEGLCFHGSQKSFWYVHVPGFHVLLDWHVLPAFTAIALTVNVVLHGKTSSSIPPSFPPTFHCYFSVMGLSLLHGGSCLGSRICQPWERSSSRSWLPIVEAPRCLRHPTSIKQCSC